jgi:hypothetical protein
MAINKTKCRAIFLAGHNASLSEKKKLLESIEGVQLVTSYKYLGAYLTKTLQP